MAGNADVEPKAPKATIGLPDVRMSLCVQCRRARNGLESWFKRGVIGQRLKRLFCAPESSLEVTTEASNVKLVPKRSSAKDLQTHLDGVSSNAESLAKEHFRRGRRGRLRPRSMHLQPPDAGAAWVATIQGNVLCCPKRIAIHAEATTALFFGLQFEAFPNDSKGRS